MHRHDFLVAVRVAGFCLWGQNREPQYRKTTIESILKSEKRMDGVRVELRGKIISGFETSVFRDTSTCKGLKVKACSVWLKYGPCTMVGGANPEMQCGSLIERLWRQQHPEEEVPRLEDRRLLVVDHVIVRGVASTVRKDVTYAKSVPKSVRVGFGHLGGYPAQLQLEELEVDKGL